MTRAIFDVREAYLERGYDLLSLDVKNAYGCLPWPIIENALDRAHVETNIRELIMYILHLRYSRETGQLSMGVAQGDCMSMLIFAYCVDPIA